MVASSTGGVVAARTAASATASGAAKTLLPLLGRCFVAAFVTVVVSWMVWSLSLQRRQAPLYSSSSKMPRLLQQVLWPGSASDPCLPVPGDVPCSDATRFVARPTMSISRLVVGWSRT
eukprot:CAMPEP_0178737134 /NCGR_PEP_ID=MMETSP0744-20121128/2810_1 /TAXON_ID=913974 /ORGANISM="Nitzschia punctata, Strain CCMP561" /LENGTH=117 /DNA_ID=CAMNT_0020389651 /DNA_START=544 /DNA_END=897 /DNA_ORIENTATION=+